MSRWHYLQVMKSDSSFLNYYIFKSNLYKGIFMLVKMILAVLLFLTVTFAQSKFKAIKLILGNWHWLGHLAIASNLKVVVGSVIVLSSITGTGISFSYEGIVLPFMAIGLIWSPVIPTGSSVSHPSGRSRPIWTNTILLASWLTPIQPGLVSRKNTSSGSMNGPNMATTWPTSTIIWTTAHYKQIQPKETNN